MSDKIIEKVSMMVGRAKSNVGEVYEAGRTTGYKEGYEYGKSISYDVCQEEIRDKFWDLWQENGARSNYTYAFVGPQWTDETFKPKHQITPIGGNGQYMFMRTSFKKPDLSMVDFSRMGGNTHLFKDSTVEELGVLDFSSTGPGWNGLNQTFYNCLRLRKIEKIILPSGSIKIDGFGECRALEEIRFEGKIYDRTFFGNSPLLSRESIKNIIDCLDPNTSGTSITFSATAVSEAFGIGDWSSLIATRPGWEFILS